MERIEYKCEHNSGCDNKAIIKDHWTNLFLCIEHCDISQLTTLRNKLSRQISTLKKEALRK